MDRPYLHGILVLPRYLIVALDSPVLLDRVPDQFLLGGTETFWKSWSGLLFWLSTRSTIDKFLGFCKGSLTWFPELSGPVELAVAACSISTLVQ